MTEGFTSEGSKSGGPTIGNPTGDSTGDGDQHLVAAVEERLAEAGRRSRVVGLASLTAGASRATHRIELEAVDGSRSFVILQHETGDEPRRADGMRLEAAALAAAARAGVRCPQVVAVNEPPSASATGPLGPSWMITEAVAGESIARRILVDDRFVDARPQLGPQLGRTLGLLHRGVDPESLPGLEGDDPLVVYRERADEIDLISPAFEAAFRYLEDNRPVPLGPALVHGDFRLGNLLVDTDGLTSVLDWELVHRGDPREDLGWVCVKAWRFGGAAPVAGVGDYQPFLDAYAETSGTEVGLDDLRWWELLGSLKWGIMCGLQASRHADEQDRGVELLAIGNRIAEQEEDVLRLLGRERSADRSRPGARSRPKTRDSAGGTHRSAGGAVGGGRPSALDLIEAVEEQLRSDRSGDRSQRFRNLVAANALAVARRDLAAGAKLAEEQQRSLAAIGVADETELAAAIRSGRVDATAPEVLEAMGAVVDGRLSVTNPGWPI